MTRWVEWPVVVGLISAPLCSICSPRHMHRRLHNHSFWVEIQCKKACSSSARKEQQFLASGESQHGTDQLAMVRILIQPAPLTCLQSCTTQPPESILIRNQKSLRDRRACLQRHAGSLGSTITQACGVPHSGTVPAAPSKWPVLSLQHLCPCWLSPEASW